MTYKDIKEKRETLVKAVLELREDVRKASKNITDEKEYKALVKTYEMCSKLLDVYIQIID